MVPFDYTRESPPPKSNPQPGYWYNRGVKKIRSLWWIILAAGLLAGCASGTGQNTPVPATPSDVPVITLYQTTAPTQLLPAATATATSAPAPTLPPLPTPTPFLYTVVEGDTMIGIAINFGVSLDELMVANPEVDPYILSVGTPLVIPLPQETAAAENGETAPSEPAPLALETAPLACTAVRTGGLWCAWLVTNQGERPVENLTAIFRLYGAGGQEVASQTAMALLNLLPAGKQMPLVSYFAPPVPAWQQAQAQWLTGVEANQAETRYLAGEVEASAALGQTGGFENAVTAVSGTVRFAAAPAAAPAYIWVLAVGYDADDQVVAVRRWEAPADLLGGQVIPFAFELYSLGKAVVRVDTLLEARGAAP